MLGEALEAARAIGSAASSPDAAWYRSEYQGAMSWALAALAPYLGPTERDQALHEALEAARAIADARDRSPVLAALAPHLTEPLLGEALEAARAIGSAASSPGAGRYRSQYQGAMSRALAALAPYLGPTERDRALREALEAARASGWQDMSRALAALAPYLGPTERDRALREALAAARAIGYEWSRFHALAALIPRLGPTERDQAVREALAAARALDSEQFTRGSALTELAPHLTAPLLGEALEAARAIGDAEYRSGALSALAPRLTELPLAMLSSLWSITLRLSAIRTRRNVLRDLIALVPVLSALGGAEAMAETARAIQDVGRWWP